MLFRDSDSTTPRDRLGTAKELAEKLARGEPIKTLYYPPQNVPPPAKQ